MFLQLCQNISCLFKLTRLLKFQIGDKMMDMVLVLQGLTSHLTHYRSFRRRNNGTCPFKITIITSI